MGLSPDALRDTATNAARAGGRALAPFREQRRRLDVREKGARDFVTAADVAAERAIRLELARTLPGHPVLGEEQRGAALATSGPLWIVDPLDGTANFIHGYPASAVAVACAIDGQVVAAAVLDVVRDLLYAAARGEGTTEDGRPVRVSGATDLAQGLVATGFPFRRMHRLEPFLAGLADVLRAASGVRRAGSAALDLAWVASGRLDAFWEEGLGPWDIAAGSLLVEEAGGRVTDFSGGRRFLETGAVIAATPALHEPLRAIVHEAQGDGAP